MKKLPLLAHWCDDLFTVDYQCELIEKGVPIMANVDMESNIDYYRQRNYRKLLELCNTHQIPVTFVGTQWEQCIVKGEKLSPFTDVSEMEDAAHEHFGTPGMEYVQHFLPNPKQVFFLSNNETPKWKWSEVGEEFGRRYKADCSDAQVREILRDNYIAMFNKMFLAARYTLPDAWQGVSKFIGYKAFPISAIGRWDGWPNYSDHTHEMLAWEFGCWDGCSAKCYQDNWSDITDYTVWSPQIECMNYLWAQNYMPENYYFELSIWDGNYHWDPSVGVCPEFADESKSCQYALKGQKVGPKRWVGFAQYCMWLMRCNIREWRHYNVNPIPWEDHTQELVDMVCRVWDNETLKKFWVEGVLVERENGRHPYDENTPITWKSERKFHLLETSVEPDTLRLGSEIPVFALALQVGEEFLLYAHAPLGEEMGVEIRVPGYGCVKVDVPVKGRFWLLRKVACDVVY